jgi:hypothetical protein
LEAFDRVLHDLDVHRHASRDVAPQGRW